MPSPRRIPSWLLIVATAAICVGTLKLESADLFPLWRFAVQWSPQALPSSRAVPVRRSRERIADPVAHARGRRPERSCKGPPSQQARARRRVGTRRQRLVLRRRKADVCVGRRCPHSWWEQPDQGAAPGIPALFPTEIRTARAASRRFVQRAAQPVRRIVIHDDVRRDGRVDWYFANPLAYDIARAIGADRAGNQAGSLFPERRVLRSIRRHRTIRRTVLCGALGIRRHPAEPGGDEQAVGMGPNDPAAHHGERLAAREHRQPDAMVPGSRILRHARRVSRSRTVSRSDQGDRAAGSGSTGTWTRVSAIGTSTAISTCSNVSTKNAAAEIRRNRGRSFCQSSSLTIHSIATI